MRLKSIPLRTYLFVTVMRMLLPQYDRIGRAGWPLSDEGAMFEERETGRDGLDAEEVLLSSRSKCKSLFFSSAIRLVIGVEVRAPTVAGGFVEGWKMSDVS